MNVSDEDDSRLLRHVRTKFDIYVLLDLKSIMSPLIFGVYIRNILKKIKWQDMLVKSKEASCNISLVVVVVLKHMRQLGNDLQLNILLNENDIP